MKIKCLVCDENYICDITNTVQIGPILETSCPFCGRETIKNFSKFVALQLNDDIDNYGRLGRATSQIRLAQEIAGLVNEDSPKKKK